MKSLFLVLFSMSLVLITNTGCTASFWKGWGKGLAAGKTAGVDDLPAGSAPASKVVGDVEPYSYRSYESLSGGAYKESGMWVNIHKVYFLDGSVTYYASKTPFTYRGSWVNIDRIERYLGVVDDPAGWKVAGIVYGPKRPNFKR